MLSIFEFLRSQLLSSYVDGMKLGDTPGIIYGISYVVSCYVYTHTNPRRRGDAKSNLKQFGLSLFLILFLIVTKDVPKIIFPIFVIVEFVLVCVVIGIGCNMNLRNTIYYGVRAYVLGEFAASLEWQLFYYIVRTLGIKLGFISQSLAILFVFGVIYSIATVIELYINQDGVHLHVEQQELVATVTIGVLIYVFSNISYLSISTPFTVDDKYALFIIRTLVDSAGIIILSFYHVLLKESHARIEATQMETLLQMQYSNYQISKEGIDLVNQKYHDMKHQIAILRTQTSAEKMKYLDQIEDEIREFEVQNKTGNETLDAILTSKKMQCQSKEIKLTTVADGSAINFMNIMDISNLFGNMLDNAMEACEKLEDPKMRLIHLAVSQDKGFLRISCENQFSGQVIIHNGLPQTTKHDNRYHGFGVKSIRAVTEKYNGSLTIHAEDGWFRLNILIPL